MQDLFNNSNQSPTFAIRCKTHHDHFLCCSWSKKCNKVSPHVWKKQKGGLHFRSIPCWHQTESPLKQHIKLIQISSLRCPYLRCGHQCSVTVTPDRITHLSSAHVPLPPPKLGWLWLPMHTHALIDTVNGVNIHFKGGGGRRDSTGGSVVLKWELGVGGASRNDLMIILGDEKDALEHHHPPTYCVTPCTHHCHKAPLAWLIVWLFSVKFLQGACSLIRGIDNLATY